VIPKVPPLTSVMAGGSDGGDLLKAAERVWGMLDKLAVDNPEEYTKFVKQQLDEGKEVLAAPEPRLCLRCSIDRVGCGASAATVTATQGWKWGHAVTEPLIYSSLYFVVLWIFNIRLVL